MNNSKISRRLHSQLFRCCLGASGLVGVASNCLAADKSWTNTLGGTFATTSNWLNGLPAGVNDVACFNNSTLFGQHTYTVTFGAGGRRRR